MLSWLSSRSRQQRKADELYGAVVTQARMPAFYEAYGVPDTMAGRYEMIVLHLALLLERLRGEGKAADETSRLVLERFVTDMDDCMREIGVGDMTVPKKVKKAAAGFYERAHAYRVDLRAGNNEGLAASLSQFIVDDPAEDGDEAVHVDGDKLAAYMQTASSALADQALAQICDGRLDFIDPQRTAGAKQAR